MTSVGFLPSVLISNVRACSKITPWSRRFSTSKASLAVVFHSSSRASDFITVHPKLALHSLDGKADVFLRAVREAAPHRHVRAVLQVQPLPLVDQVVARLARAPGSPGPADLPDHRVDDEVPRHLVGDDGRVRAEVAARVQGARLDAVAGGIGADPDRHVAAQAVRLHRAVAVEGSWDATHCP